MNSSRMLKGSVRCLAVKDRLADILELTVTPAAAKRETGNVWSARDPSPESIAEIQINPPTFGPEADTRIEQAGVMIHDEAVTAFRRGNAYFAVKNYGRAVSDYTRALEYAPRYPEIYFNRAIAQEKAGRISKALQDYSSAVSVDPQYVKAYCNRAFLCWSQGDRDQALEDMKKAARLGLREMQGYLKSKGIDW